MLQFEINESPSVEAELKRQREENRQLKMERDILNLFKKSDALLCKKKRVRHQFINENEKI